MIGAKEWAMAKILQEQGVSNTEIARRLSIDRKTVGRALQREELPFYPTGSCRDRRPWRASKLDRYKEYIRDVWRGTKSSATNLYLKIQGEGATTAAVRW